MSIFQGSALSSMCYRMQNPKLKAFPCSYLPGCILFPPREASASHTTRTASFPNGWFWFSVWVWVVPSWRWRKHLNLESLLLLIWCYWRAVIKWITQSMWPVSSLQHIIQPTHFQQTFHCQHSDRKRLNNSATSEFHSRFPLGWGEPSYNNSSFSLEMERL